MPEKQRPKVSKYDMVSGVDTYATQTSQNPETSRRLTGWIPSDDGGLYREWNDPTVGTGLPSPNEVKRLFQFDWIDPVSSSLTRYFFAIVATSPGASTFFLWSYAGGVWTHVTGVGTLQNVPAIAKVQSANLLHLSDGVRNWLFDGNVWVQDGMNILLSQPAIDVIGAWHPAINYGAAIAPNYGLISDSNGNIEFASGTGVTGYTQPTWPTVVGKTLIDGSVTWVNVGPPTSWQSGQVYATNAVLYNSNGTFMRASVGGTSGASEPIWDERVNHTTVDNTVTWTNCGKFVTNIGNLAPGISSIPAWQDYEWAAAQPYVLGNFIIDKNGNLQQITSAGTSGNSIPLWNSQVGQPTTDNTATWINLGLIGNLVAWQVGTLYNRYQLLIDSNGCFQICFTTGTSGTIEPTWSLSTADGSGSLVWQFVGPANVGPPPQANIGKYYWFTQADLTSGRVHQSSSSAISVGTGPLNHQQVNVYPQSGFCSVNSGSPTVTILPRTTLQPGPQMPIVGAWMIGLHVFILSTGGILDMGQIAHVSGDGKSLTLVNNSISTGTSSFFIGDARVTNLYLYQSESDGSKIGQQSLVTPEIAQITTFSTPIPYPDFSPFLGQNNTSIITIARPVRNDPPPTSLLAEVHKYRIFRRREARKNFFNFTANEEVSSGINGDPTECVPGADVNTLSDLVDEQIYPDASNFIRAFCSHGDALYIGTEKQTIPMYGQSIDDFGLSQVTAFSLGVAGRFAMISTAHGLAMVSYDKKVYMYPTSNYYWAYVPNDVNVTDNLLEIGKPLRKVLEQIDPAFLDETQLTFYFYGRRNWLVLTFRDLSGLYQTWVYDFTNKGWFKLANGYSSVAVWEISTGVKVLVGGSPQGGVFVLDDLTGTFTSSGNLPNSVWRPALIDFGDPDSKHIPLYIEFEISNDVMANDIAINYYLDPVDVDNPPTPRSVTFQKVSGSNLYRGFFQGGNLCQRLLLEFNAQPSPVSTNSGHIRGIKLVANPASGLIR